MTAAQKKTAGLAIASLVLGILGFIMLGPLGAIPAVICGHMAKSKIKASEGALDGDGMALAGIIMGYVNIGLLILMIPLCAAIAIPAFHAARNSAQRSACINNMRMITDAKAMVTLESGSPEGTEVSNEQLSEFLLDGGVDGMTCAQGGSYTTKPLGESPECSVHGSLEEALQSAQNMSDY